MDDGNVAQNSFVDRDRDLQLAKERFEPLEATSEFMETYYFDSKASSTGSLLLVGLNSFWVDLAAHFLKNTGAGKSEAQTYFLTENFTHCTEPRVQFLASCFLDLPADNEMAETCGEHIWEADQARGSTLTLGTNAVIFTQQIKEVPLALDSDCIVSHRYIRMDKYGQQNKSDEDPAVPSEFVKNVPYQCEVVVTNVSPMSLEDNATTLFF